MNLGQRPVAPTRHRVACADGATKPITMFEIEMEMEIQRQKQATAGAGPIGTVWHLPVPACFLSSTSSALYR